VLPLWAEPLWANTLRGKEEAGERRSGREEEEEGGTNNHWSPVLLLCFYLIAQTWTAALSVVATAPPTILLDLEVVVNNRPFCKSQQELAMMLTRLAISKKKDDVKCMTR